MSLAPTPAPPLPLLLLLLPLLSLLPLHGTCCHLWGAVRAGPTAAAVKEGSVT